MYIRGRDGEIRFCPVCYLSRACGFIRNICLPRGREGVSEMARDFAKAFYASEAWKKTRASFAISRGWLCEECLAAGIYTPGKVVHHIVKLTPQNIHNPEIALSWGNLKLVCQDCHAKEHKGVTTERYFFDDDGNVCPPIRKIGEGSK